MGQGGQAQYEQEAESGRIDLLAREFLPAGSRESPFFKYYLYLLIADATPDQAPRRAALARAYMCQFPTASEAERLAVPKEKLAVFYAPTANARRPESPKELIDNYGYGMARMLVQRLGREADLGVYASPVPVLTSEDISQGDFLDLSSTPPAQIAGVVRSLRLSVEGPYSLQEVDVVLKTDPETGQALEIEKHTVPVVDDLPRETIADQIRSIFGTIGELLIPAAAATAEECSR